MYFSILLVAILIFLPISHGQVAGKTLQQIHVIFRHGERTPDPYDDYRNDPYINDTYYPIGKGGLTLNGKMQEYTIGENLRKRYGEFLGNIYTSDIIDARSTDVPRAKMSLQLVLAGLWPPTDVQIWHNQLKWQPIPYNHEPSNSRLMGIAFQCKEYYNEYMNVLNSEETKNVMNSYDWLFKYVNEHSGLSATSQLELAGLYFTLYTQRGVGKVLPEWTDAVFPNALEEMAIQQYIIQTKNEVMKSITAGPLIGKIIEDATAKIQGSSKTQLYLYSGHEYNIANTLRALDAYYPHIPPYGSQVIFELHKVNGRYGFQVFYTNPSETIPQSIQIPGCDIFCPLDVFQNLTYPLTNYQPACGILKKDLKIAHIHIRV